VALLEQAGIPAHSEMAAAAKQAVELAGEGR